jgi:hypothetical protein
MTIRSGLLVGVLACSVGCSSVGATDSPDGGILGGAGGAMGMSGAGDADAGPSRTSVHFSWAVARL